MVVLFLVFLGLMGACFGSFLCCQARRLRLRELSRPLSSQRSVCLACGQGIKWYDNLPLLSWLLLRGKCRHCHARIGLLEPLSELSLTLAFLVIGLRFCFAHDLFTFAISFSNLAAISPLDWLVFIVTLIFTLALGFLAIYDGAYGELPNLALTISLICAIIIVILKQWSLFTVAGFTPSLVLDPLGSVALLGGVYLLLYLVSRGRWVGDGDWLLGTALGLVLANPWLALLTLCLANLLACCIMLPIIYLPRPTHHSRSHRRKTSSAPARATNPHQLSAAPHIHLGPFLIAAFYFIYLLADFFCQWQPNML